MNKKKLINVVMAFFVLVAFVPASHERDKYLPKSSNSKLRLITLDPGHYHAALIQKSMFADIDSTVHVYAPDGPEVKAHLKIVDTYNSRPQNPTAWKEKVYLGNDYLLQMMKEQPGGIVVIAGNNQKKTEYIKKSIEAGLNVLADKPMAIRTADFEVLKNAFNEADKKKVLLYDIMTSRYNITNILQKEFTHLPEIFGRLITGTAAIPAVEITRTHYFLKYVAGAPLIRPVWYFDVNQAGEGIVDVTTHMVDLVQWEGFGEEVFDYKKDIKMLSAKRWPTQITPSQFKTITNSAVYPEYLKKDITDSILSVYANGEMNYTIKGIHAKLIMNWAVRATEGNGDTHYSRFRGTMADVVIQQGKEQQYKSTLYIECNKVNKATIKKSLQSSLRKIYETYPGVTLKEIESGWQVIIPEKYEAIGERNYELVTNKYLEYLKKGVMPAWEKASMIAKYYTTTQALEKALMNKL